MRVGPIDLELVAAAIGRMSQEDLSILADYLVMAHEGRALKLATFIDFAHQDKCILAEEEVIFE